MLPVRPFKSVFGTEVKSITLITDTSGQLSFLDIEGHIIANLTVNETTTKKGEALPAWSPESIVKPSHMNDYMFGVLSSSARFDAFRLHIEDTETARRAIWITHEWAVSLASQGVQGRIVASSSSRQKHKFRFSLLDSNNILTSFLRDGRKDGQKKLSKDFEKITAMKPMPHSIVMQS